MPWLATNAPFHWPNLWVAFNEPENEPKCRLEAMAQFVDAAREQGGHLKLAAVATMQLVDEGVLELPFEVEDEGRNVPVFVYGTADAKSAGHFEAARGLLEGLGAPPPVYLAPEPLPAPEPVDPVRPFGADVFSEATEKPPDGEYAMWWTTPEDPSFATSPTVDSIDRAYRALEGIETYVLAAILRELERVDENTGRAALPEEEKTLVVRGPEHRFLVLSISQEKGVRFHMHTKTTPVAYRERFWRHFAKYAEEWRTGAVSRNLSFDPPSPMFGHPTGWWGAAKTAGTRHDPGKGADHVMTFGMVLVGAREKRGAP